MGQIEETKFWSLRLDFLKKWVNIVHTRSWGLVTGTCPLVYADLITYMYLYRVSDWLLLECPIALLNNRQYPGLYKLHVHVIHQNEFLRVPLRITYLLRGREVPLKTHLLRLYPIRHEHGVERQVVMHTYPVTLGKLFISCSPV